MAKREKLPLGLYRRRRRDGTPGDILWCQWRPHGSKQPVKLSTGTSDIAEAKRFLHARLAEDPKARTHRVAATRVTTADALVLYTLDAGDHGVQAHQGRVAALRHALGDVPLADLTRARLDALCRVWRTVGVDYPERDPRHNHLRPVSGATCNRLMATLRRARTLAIDKLGVELPRLTFPHFAEAPAGRYVSPEEFYAILSYFTDPTKGAFVELLYLLGIRPGQLRGTEISNVRVEKGKPVALVYRPDQVKQRTPHEVPLVGIGRAQEIVHGLWRARALGCKFLFHVNGKPLRELKSEWRRACEAAGFVAGRKGGGIVLYNLWHSCLTNLADAGVPDTTARAISGHKTDSAHRRYVITQTATKVAALAAMAATVERARQGLARGHSVDT